MSVKPTRLTLNNSAITLYNGDCFNVLKSVEDNSIDCIVTDPPYNIDFKGTTSSTEWDHFDDGEFYEFLVSLYFAAGRVLKPSSSFWMFFGPTQIETVLSAFRSCDPTALDLQLNLENLCVYARNKGRGSSKKLKSLAEFILHMSKGKYRWNPVEYFRRVVIPFMKDGKPRGWALDQETGEPCRFTGAGNVMFFSTPYYLNKLQPQIHSCQKSVLALCELIMMTTQVGDTVLDPFGGSFSTGVAAVICDRNFIGIERDTDMFKKGKKWLESINYEEAEEYVKKRLSSSEKFKFGFSSRSILPKATSS